MAAGARYAIVPNSDSAITIPNSLGINDHHYQGIQAPGVDRGRSGVLFFRVNPDGSSQLRIRLNSTVVFDISLVEGPLRTLNEIIPGSAIQAADNELTVSVTGSGNVTISDIVILYTATI